MRRWLINRRFARLWGAGLVSSLGDWVGILAIVALVARLGSQEGGAAGASWAVAAVMSARVLALVAISPIAGSLVDRFDRRLLLIRVDLVRAGVVALMPFVGLWSVIVLSAILEAAGIIWAPARDALLPRLVTDDQLPQANSANLIATWGTLPVGATVFAMLAVTWQRAGSTGPPEAMALLVDAASFVVAAAMVTRLHLPSTEAAVPQDSTGQGLLKDGLDGWRLVARERPLRRLVLAISVAFVGVGALTGLGPVFTRFDLATGQAGFGALVASLGLGGLVGLAVVSALGPRPGLDRILTLGLACSGVALGAVALAPSLGLAVAAAFPAGVAAGAAWVAGYSLMESVDDAYRGRVLVAATVLSRFVLLGSRVAFPALAAVLSAWSASSTSMVDLSGTRLALLAGAATLLVAAVIARPVATHV